MGRRLGKRAAIARPRHRRFIRSICWQRLRGVGLSLERLCFVRFGPAPWTTASRPPPAASRPDRPSPWRSGSPRGRYDQLVDGHQSRTHRLSRRDASLSILTLSLGYIDWGRAWSSSAGITGEPPGKDCSRSQPSECRYSVRHRPCNRTGRTLGCAAAKRMNGGVPTRPRAID